MRGRFAVLAALCGGGLLACSAAGPYRTGPAASGAAEIESAEPTPWWTAAVELDGADGLERLSAYRPPAADTEPDKRGFLTVERLGGERRWTSGLYPFWKIRAGDLDGDGRAEVVLGVWSRRRRHAEPEPHRTVWVLAWERGRLVERWRGSALARPLRDFELQPGPDGREELVALEQTDDACVVTLYRWTGFGFSGRGYLARGRHARGRYDGCASDRFCDPDYPPGCVVGPSGRWRPLERDGRVLRAPVQSR